MMENNLVPQGNNLKPLKTSEEKFELARRGKQIQFAAEKEITEALRYAMAKIGMRGENYPKGEMKMLLIQHVFDNFGENRVDEIKLAFDWGIEGRLDEDINCFENFSCLYFTRIMRAYNRLALAVKEEKKDEPKKLPAPKKEERIEDPAAYDEFLKTGFAKILQNKGIEIPKW